MADLNNITPMKELPLFLQYFRTVGIIPASYKVTMTYEEQVLELMRFIRDEIIPKINENVLATQELQEKFKELVTYVDEYFGNLDIQEEVNVKLNEMAESGTLTEIIAQYLQLAGVLVYNTTENLKNATNIVNGSICRTLGDKQYNDGKGYFYKIRNITTSDTIDELNILAINNSDTLIAERILNIVYDKSNPIYYGADPTGTNDSSTAIQNCINANINSQIIFTPGIYLLNNPIEIPYDNQYGGIDFNNSLLINNTENDYCIGIGTKNHILTSSNSIDKNNRLYNITNLKMKTHSTYAILIDRWFMNVHFDNIDIYCYKNGIQIGKLYSGSDNKPSDCLLENFLITCNNMNENYTGINIIGTDNKIIDGRIYGFKTGINCNKHLLQINNIHFLATNYTTPIDENYIAIKDVDTAYIDNCYCDSYPVFVKYVSGGSHVFVNNLFVYSWTKNMSHCRIFDYSELKNQSSTTTLHINNAKVNVGSYPLDFNFIYTGLLGIKSSTLTNGMASFISNSKFNNIVFTSTDNNENVLFDLSKSTNIPFVNNCWASWIDNWVHVGNLICLNNTVAILEATDIDLGSAKFRIECGTDGNITTITRIYRDSTNENYSLAVKKIKEKCYKVYLAKNKDSLNTKLYSQQKLSLSNPAIRLIPATIEDYVYGLNNTTNVDIIST